MQETFNMTRGSISKVMTRFAVPVLIGNLFQQLYNTADSMIVGNTLGKEALAGVTSTGSLIYLIIGLFYGLAMGAGTVISRFIGARDDEATGKAVHTTVALGLVCGIVVSVAGSLMAETMLRWMGSPEDVRPISTRYLRIYFAGGFFVVMYDMFVGILQATGDSRHPLYYLAASSVINIVLDLLFIRVFDMDVEGAAIATVISQAFSAFMAGAKLLRSRDATRLRIRRIGFDRETCKLVLRYGLPTGAQGAVIDFSNVLIQTFINSFGKIAMGGFGAYSRIEGFIFLPVTAFQMATATFVSQNIGANEFERARKGIFFGVGTTMVLSEIIGLIVTLFCRPILSWFNTDAEVIRYGMMRGVVCAPFMLLPAYAHAMSAVMRGIGKPVTPMVVLLSCWCAVRVAVLFTVGKVWHDPRLVCWIYPFTWTLSTIVYTVYAVKLTKQLPWLKRGKTL